jgi:hypothetical protein
MNCIIFLTKFLVKKIVIVISVVNPDLFGIAFSLGWIWIRIRIGNCGSASGSRRAKMTYKSEDISSFEVLDVLF